MILALGLQSLSGNKVKTQSNNTMLYF